MTTQSKIPSSLLKSDNAVGNYLDELLHQATRVAEVEEATAAQVIDKELLPGVLVVEELQAEEQQPEDLADAAGESKQLSVEDEVEISQGGCFSLPLEMFPLQCLMFKVGDNSLSIPLAELAGIVEWTDNMTRLPHEPDWVLGILNYRDHNVRVVDSAGILQIKVKEPVTANHILVFGEDGWGITCDQLEQVVKLEYDDIQWHPTSSNKRVFGTVRQSLTSLLNPQGIVKKLQAGL